MCTLANCSVLILTEKYRGFYIHGRAPWERSDLPMGWLKQELDEEAKNARKSRAMGAEAVAMRNNARALNDVGNTYEIFIQPDLRANFDSWNNTPLEKMDNRNLSDKEYQLIEDSKRRQTLKRATAKDLSVV